MEEALRVLISEDQPADAELEVRELKRAGMRVMHRVVDTEGAFREALREFQPELIISDFSMPHFDGMWALSLARELAPDTPFIFVSGSIGEDYAIRALKNGATDYVLKSNLVRLPAAVERALRGAREALERRNAEAQLRLQGAALDAAVNAIVITGLDGTIRWVNRAFSALTGYAAEEMIGQNPRMLKSGLHGPEFYRQMFETVLGGSVWRGEVVNRYKDGRLGTEEMTITPVRDSDGAITHFIAIKQDVTPRKQEEKHRARLTAILEASPDFVATADPNGAVLYYNSAARRMLELPEDVEPSQVRIGDTHPQWAAELVLKTGIPSAIRDGVWNGETTFLTRSGREIPVIQVILAHKGPDGNVEFLSTIARDISERKSHEQKIGRLNRIHEVLSGINSAIVRIRDRGELFRESCRIAVEHGKFGMAWIGKFDAAAQEVTPLACAGLEANEFVAGFRSTIRKDLPQGRGVLARAIRSREPVFENDITVNPAMGGKRRAEAIRRGYRSVVVLPLIVGGKVEGTMSLFAREMNFFDHEEMKLLNELAGDISFALDHIAKEEKLEKLSRIRAVSGEINAAIVRIREREALLEETCRVAAEHGKFEMIWIGAVDSGKQEIRTLFWNGFSDDAARAVTWQAVRDAQGTLGEAIRTRRTVVRNDIETQYSKGRLREEALKRGCLSNVCLPLVVDDSVVGLIGLFAPGRGYFDKDELALLEEVAADVSFALQSISRQEQLEYLSYYDTLTGLPNRQLFVDRLSQHLHARGGEQRMVALILLNLERFRNMNETLGRHGGDDLLRKIAGRLERTFQGKDNLAHMGADNFGVVIRGVRDAAEVAHAVENQVLGCLAEPFEIGGKQLRATARAGVALFPADGGDADTLFKNAEAALTKARVSGERYLFYAPQMNARVAEQLKLENDLRNALLQEQYVLYYQPRFDFTSRRITGLEALIRWKHPERGMVSPGEFIPILEETGMIVEAGRWALRRAALDHTAWSAAGLQPPRIAVNVSAVQLRRRDFVGYVKDALADVDGTSERVDIEITESMLMEDIGGSIAKLEALQAMGLQVALDDFGTGYSSLSYLARLPINSLKIDRSFITQMPKSPEQMAIVSTVISLARALNLKVVAEGVETEEQANLLRLLRCDEAQGYLYAKPMPPDQIEALLAGRQ
jgi:diguanylate cyclase (GGDEF)-like protein/PAS domain S-box-containing protein